MSKELEAFNEIIDKFAEQMIRANIEELTATNKTNAIKYLYRTPQVRLLNESLQRLEAIENAKPSEAFECSLKLYKMVESAGNDNGFSLNEAWKYHNIIKQALIKANEDEYENERLWNDITTVSKQYTDLMLEYQEQKKVLEIIVEKKIDVNKFQTSLIVMSNFTYKHYINNSRDYHTCIMVKLLTEEEFELLKRYCDEEK